LILFHFILHVPNFIFLLVRMLWYAERYWLDRSIESVSFIEYITECPADVMLQQHDRCHRFLELHPNITKPAHRGLHRCIRAFRGEARDQNSRCWTGPWRDSGILRDFLHLFSWHSGQHGDFEILIDTESK